MSVSHPRFGRNRRFILRQRDENIMRTLTYHDSDGESSPHDGDCGSSPYTSPLVSNSDRMEESSEFLELDIPTPTIVSPKPIRRMSRIRKLSPIPFTFDEGHEGDIDEEEQRVPTPGITVLPPSPGPVSPPHRKLRALRLFDTPHTPKSLLQKSRRRRLTDERKKLEPKVEANVNPFTPNNNRPVLSCGKRNRSQMERYYNISFSFYMDILLYK